MNVACGRMWWHVVACGGSVMVWAGIHHGGRTALVNVACGGMWWHVVAVSWCGQVSIMVVGRLL